ncbi:unnamed protein product [Urochloa decumbens]|uniref:DUF6598 domain-containing protein n=1 Tax=Urochloa decumbens TaxID=240449 RepID=A0ABC8YQ81_9POAL
MEKATEVLMREGLKERDCSDLEVESQQILGCEEDDAFWDNFEADTFWDNNEEVYVAPPVTRYEHAETKASCRKMVATVAWSDDEEEEEDDDDPDREALRFRKGWNYIWSRKYGCFEDTTRIPPMRYTDEPPLKRIYPCHTLQVFSAKIAGLGDGFQWPLDVFGLVAIRDPVDRNRNIIFQRSRVECQTLSEKDPHLVLTGPTRAVVLSDPVTIEVYLKVKGPIELKDKTLCFLADEILCLIPVHSCLLHRTCTSRFSTLEFTLGHIIFSVEAAIFVRVVDGTWPNGFHGQFSASMVSSGVTSSVDHDCEDEVPVIGGTTSVNHKKVILLSFGDEKLPMIGDGVVELSRRVVSVEVNSKLKVSVKAWQNDKDVMETVEEFMAKEADRSFGTLDIGSCKMDVIVAWSLVSNHPEPR